MFHATSTAKFLWAAQRITEFYGTACKLKELHENFMQAYVTASKLMELYARSQNCIQCHGTACTFM